MVRAEIEVGPEFFVDLVGVGGAPPVHGRIDGHLFVQVGHAAPACVFRDVEIFGGD